MGGTNAGDDENRIVGGPGGLVDPYAEGGPELGGVEGSNIAVGSSFTVGFPPFPGLPLFTPKPASDDLAPSLPEVKLSSDSQMLETSSMLKTTALPEAPRASNACSFEAMPEPEPWLLQPLLNDPEAT